jgi:hypothetical protein
MARTSCIALLLALAGCASAPAVQPQFQASPCAAAGESSYACQVQRYHDVAQ